MHGILHKSLKGYVGEHVPGTSWDEVLDAAGIEPKLYLPVSRYPDEEFTGAMAVVAERTDTPEAVVQRKVGRHLAPDLLDTFKAHVKAGWGTREVLANLDRIYTQIEASDDEADFPTVATGRIAEDTYIVQYQSELRLCHLAKGIIEGIAAQFDDDVAVSEDTCMHDGDGHCELTVEFA